MQSDQFKELTKKVENLVYVYGRVQSHKLVSNELDSIQTRRDASYLVILAMASIVLNFVDWIPLMVPNFYKFLSLSAPFVVTMIYIHRSTNKKWLQSTKELSPLLDDIEKSYLRK